jgi:O-antigen/teichoic acid export membrane protein
MLALDHAACSGRLAERKQAPLLQMTRVIARLFAHRGDLLSGVAGQSLLSAASFAVSLVLVRVTEKEHFGLYTLGTTVLTLAGGMMNALVYTQMTVTSPRLQPAARPAYHGALLQAQYLVLVPVVLAGVVAVVLFGSNRGLDPRQARLLAPAVGIACLGYALLEFSRRLNYLTGDGPRALVYDSIYVALLGLGLALLVALGGSAQLYWVTFALICGAAVACGLPALKRHQLPLTAARSKVQAVLTDSWRNGSWALAGMLITWVQSSAYVFILQHELGATAVADANAARLLLVPPLVLQTGLGIAVLPRLASRTAAGDRGAAAQLALKVFGPVLLGVLLYTALVLSVWEPLSGVILGSAYVDLRTVVLAWAAVIGLIVVRAGLSVLLQAERRFRALTLAGLAAAALVLLGTVVLVRQWGVIGAVMALGAGELLLVSLLTALYLGSRRREG